MTATELKSRISILEVCRELGIELKQVGKQTMAICPFHEDKNPSFSVDSSKGLFHCFGCKKGGDVIKLVELKKSLDFKSAFKWLADSYGLNGSAKALAKGEREAHVSVPAKKRQELLSKVVQYYSTCLKGSEKAVDYLKRRGIYSEEIIEHFNLGFSDRSLKSQLSESEFESLSEIGLFRTDGNRAEHFWGCLVFPITSSKGEMLELYGRRVRDRSDRSSHLYLKGEHKGVFNETAFQSESLILCESIIDALTFYVSGFKDVTASYGVNGFTKVHFDLLKESSVKEVIIAYDSDEGGAKGAEALLETLKVLNIRVSRLILPLGSDVNEYALSYQEDARLSRLKELLERREHLFIPVEKKPPPFDLSLSEKELSLSFRNPLRKYRIRGIMNNTSIEHMKVNLKAEMDFKFHLDVLDLYSAKQRTFFIKECEHILGLSKDFLLKDFSRVLTEVEKAHDSFLAGSLEPLEEDYVISEEEEEEALQFLKDPDLIKKLLDDFEKLGYVGDDLNKVVVYLCCISRLLDDPLSVMIVSRSAAGKSSLQDAVLKLIPLSSQVKFTAMTGQSLFYMDEGSLEHKVLAVSENEGASRAGYALKTLDSEGELRIASTGKDPLTGKMKTHEYVVKGPTALLLTTTETELDYELGNRLITLTVDEDCRQTQRIHEQQRKDETLEGTLLKRKRKKTALKHQNVNRLLRKLTVVNPFAEKLTFITSKLRTRRDHKKYLRLIKAVTFLFQYQREVKSYDGMDYIESSMEDIELAGDLAKEILSKSLDELSPPSRSLVEIIKELVQVKEIDEGEGVRFTRKELRDFSKWDHWQIRDHIRQLEDLEFIRAVSGKKGQRYEYELCVFDEEDLDIGLTDLKETGAS